MPPRMLCDWLYLACILGFIKIKERAENLQNHEDLYISFNTARHNKQQLDQDHFPIDVYG